MSSSPFLPAGSRSRRSRAYRRRRRRRQRRQLAAVALGLALLTALALFALVIPGSGRGNHRRHDSVAKKAARSPRTPIRRSQTGLPLGRASFPLHGVGDGHADPVQMSFSEPPSAGILFDLSSGRVLWQRRALARLPIASLTKMMTALIVVDTKRPRERVLITREAVDMPGEALGMLPLNGHIEVETLLYALLLPSANDAAVALAEGVSGSVPAFVARMNAEVARLGMGCTRYSSPSGYYNAHNYSCAADLAMLAHDDLEQPLLARITASPTAILPFPIKGGKLYLTNNNPLLLYGYPGTTGMKTGYTIAAGACLVGTATRDGVRLGVVLLHSPAPGTQASELLDSAFEHVYRQTPIPGEPAIGAGV